jgi:hypothetical protein
MSQESEISRTLEQIMRVLETILERQEILIEKVNQMLQGETDLQTAVQALVAFSQTVATELTALQTAATAAAGDADTDIEAFAQTVQSSIATIQAAMPAPVVITGPTAVGSAAAALAKSN